MIPIYPISKTTIPHNPYDPCSIYGSESVTTNTDSDSDSYFKLNIIKEIT